MQTSTDILSAFEQQESTVLASEPTDAPRRSRSLPAFPLDALPVDFARFALALAEEKQVPCDMVAGFMLGVLSSAVTGRVEIRPNARQSGYTEAAQLYILVQGESSERKSSTLKTLSKPLAGYLSLLRESILRENAGRKREMEVVDSQIRHLKVTDERNALLLRERRDTLAEKLLREPEVIRGEGSMEAITQSMADHGGRIILMSAEGQLLNNLAGRSYTKAGNAVNLDAILDGYGNDATSGVRIRNGADWEIPRASVAICLGVQPELLRDFMGDKVGRGRGLHGRFLYFLPRSRIGHRSVRTDPVPPSLMTWWTNTVHRLAAIARDEEPMILPFSRDAEEAYFRYAEAIEARLLTDLGGDMQPWGGKLVGNTVRLAGLLALAEGEDMVQLRQWNMAQMIAEHYLFHHARTAFLGEDPLLGEHARTLWKLLQNVDQFDQSELWSKRARYRFDQVQDYREAIRQLSEQHYLHLSAVQKPCGGTKRPSPVWDVVREQVQSIPITEGELS